MRHQPGDLSVPDRYRVGVVVKVEDLDDLGEAGCDSSFYRIVVGPDGEVLDIGRESRRWPKGIRRAITYRDGGCAFPGCDRPPSWCDAHHCHDWDDGGHTKVDNGVLLCRSHHSFIHRRRWSITIEHGKPVFRKPDGTEHIINRWDAA